MRKLSLNVLLALGLAISIGLGRPAAVSAQTSKGNPSNADQAFETLKTLVGRWATITA